MTAGGAGFGTAGVLSGDVQLGGDSAIEFKSGQITSLTGGLYLNGSDAFIEDSTALGSNSALTGLSNVAGGLSLLNGASVLTTGPLAKQRLSPNRRLLLLGHARLSARSAARCRIRDRSSLTAAGPIKRFST